MPEATLDDLARLVGGRVDGDGKVLLRAANGLAEAGPGEISFLANPKYAGLLAATKASAVVLPDGVPCPVPALRAKNPDLAFARVVERLSGPPPRPAPGVHPSAVVHPGAKLGKDVSIGALCVVEDGASIGDGTALHPQVYVGAGAKIGPGCLLWPQVVVRERCEVGARVILHSGVVVGSDGFGYATDGGVHHKVPQVGIVVLEDDVEVGANSALDRARFGVTRVGRGTKIDNLVQIAHNVVLGRGCLIVAQVGISGSTRAGDYVVLGGQVGVAGHLELGDRAMVTAQSGIAKDLEPGTVQSGSPSRERREHLRQLASLGKLPELLDEVRRLKSELAALKGSGKA